MLETCVVLMGWGEQTQLWLFPGDVPEQLPRPCGLVSVGEVSSGAGSCCCVPRARPGRTLGSHPSGSPHQGMLRAVLG